MDSPDRYGESIEAAKIAWHDQITYAVTARGTSASLHLQRQMMWIAGQVFYFVNIPNSSRRSLSMLGLDIFGNSIVFLKRHLPPYVPGLPRNLVIFSYRSDVLITL
jgi:hypothetical protein